MLKINLLNSLANYEDGIELISRKLGVEYEISDSFALEQINICTIEEALENEEFSAFFKGSKNDKRWHAIYKTKEGGFIVCGDRKIDCMHALLKVIDRKDEDIKEYNVSRFNRLYENFDDFYSGFARAADDFDLEVHMIDTVRAGVESFEINVLYDDIPIQIREREHKNDVYYWWCTYSPGLDMFYESKLFRGVHKENMLQDNRNNLKKNARLAKALGLAPVFTTFEPRCVPERFFRKYPELRGARCDYDAYSAVTEYALDPTHPLVLSHFSEMFAMLLEDVPELALFEIWSQDSNASFPWADCSYMKRNGPLRLYDKEFHEIVNPLLCALRDTARKYNNTTKVNLNLDWVFSQREKEDIATHLPEDVGLTFSFGSLSNDNLPYEDKLRELGDEYIQYITNGIGHDWKFYAPLVGFPFPRTTFNHLNEVIKKDVHNFTLRGGLCTRAFVPDYINNEIIREVKYNDNMDVDAFLKKQAERFTDTKEEAEVLYNVWEMCDKFNNDYHQSRYNPETKEHMFWTCSLFVSPRTLFRKLVWPIVPNQLALSFNETRYYKPNMFFTYDTDPSWVDMSCFNFQQKTSDAVLIFSTKRCIEILIPSLEKILAEIDTLGEKKCEYLRDLRDRVECMLCIITTEKCLMKVQYMTHWYRDSDDEVKKAEWKKEIREEMLSDMENVKRFIKLLEESPSVLIPTTSGEETVYMYKAPMSQPLKRKLIVMQNHLDDEPEGVKLDY